MSYSDIQKVAKCCVHEKKIDVKKKGGMGNRRLAEVEDEFHFTVKCTSLYAVRDKLYDEISAIIPSFVSMTNESKFKFMYTQSEYDVIVKCINDMYNARNEIINNVWR